MKNNNLKPMKINVLIVEDCSVMRLMIKRTLNLSDMNVNSVFEAGNGKEGLEILDQHKIDLIILDMNMPVMDGMEMLRELKNKPATKSVPVLIVSTESNEKRIESIVKLGSGFVHKPFTPEILKDEIFKITLE